jgi:L-2-hydroxyglutarate oxidase LhgO
MTGILGSEAKLFFRNSFGFRSLAIDEIKKYNRKYFTGLAASMVRQLDAAGFTEWGKPGIRAQLLDVSTDELVMDFIIEGDKDSVHVLNAVSPAFTCSFPFAAYVVDKYVL